MMKDKHYFINQLSFPFVCLYLLIKRSTWKKKTYLLLKDLSGNKLYKWQWNILDRIVKDNLLEESE